MKKTNFKIILISTISFLLIGSLIFYISLLGENNKIDVTTSYFFQNIQNNNYKEILKIYSEQANGKNFNDTILNYFLLELALLKKYNLIDQDEYIIETKRNSFWYPFSNSNTVDVNVRFKQKNSSELMSGFFKKETNPSIENLITVIRENRKWKIKSINISKSPIDNIYKELKNNLKFNKYVEINENGFILKRSEINFKKVTPTELKLIQFSLQKAMEKTNTNLKNNTKITSL